MEAYNSYRGFQNLPKTMFTDRTRSALKLSAPKSNSAMSTRTYSRIKGSLDSQQNVGMPEVRKSMNFEENDLSLLDQSIPDAEELENEEELLNRMIDQQKQLQQLQDRQKRLLELQQQLASMDYNAGSSMEEKLKKLKTAKSRLDQLQNLVGTIKAAETRGGGDNAEQEINDKTECVKMALEELNDLKSLINMMSPGQDLGSQNSTPSVKPVFANAISPKNNSQSGDGYRPVLPEVSVVQQDDIQSGSEKENRSRRKNKSSPSKKVTRVLGASVPTKRSVQIREQRSNPEKTESGNTEVSEQLWYEMRRHQTLLEELRARRKELEDLMNMTKETESDTNAGYDDATASNRSNLGSPDESRGLSDTEGNDMETSQSGRLFGLNETDTRRLIDLIRNQKSLGTATEKTTATWGSSSTNTSESDEENSEEGDAQPEYEDQQDDKNDNVEDVQGSLSLMHETQKVVDQRKSYEDDHEIDFRPPTRRGTVQARKQNTVLTATSWRAMLVKLQEDLSSANTTMHLLLEDQQALTKLLQNTLNLQQSCVSNSMCYGISPDFLIYQLDNCSAQFSALQKETKALQWQLYELTKNPPSGMKKIQSFGNPFSTLAFQPNIATLTDGLTRTGMTALPMPDESRRKGMKYEEQPNNVQSYDDTNQDGTAGYFAEVTAENVAAEDNGNVDLFEALRDSIYSGAAILISQNESRPHFLIELFQILQQLNSDYLRQHCLYVLQDILKSYIPDSPRKPLPEKKFQTDGKLGGHMKKASYSENTPSESAATSEDELYTKLKAKVSAGLGYDFSLKVSSASELSTPSGEEVDNNPFAAEDLGSTVIHLDAALRHMREMERMKQEILSSTLGKQNGEDLGDSQLSGRDGSEKAMRDLTKSEVPQINTKLLKARIKHIISQVIPVLKQDRDKTLDYKFVNMLKMKVVEFVSQTMPSSQAQAAGRPTEDSDNEDKANMTNFFSDQLHSILEDSLRKFLGQRVGACGEDLVVSLSEVLFNELAFYHMMQDLGKEKSQASPADHMTKIQVEHEEAAQTDEAKDESQSLQEEKDDEDEPGDESELAAASQEEATASKSPEVGSVQGNDESFPQVTVDLSVSETKPLTSYGSGEDEEDGSGDEYMCKEPDVPTSMQHDQDAEVSSQEENERLEAEGQEENQEVEQEEPSKEPITDKE